MPRTHTWHGMLSSRRQGTFQGTWWGSVSERGSASSLMTRQIQTEIPCKSGSSPIAPTNKINRLRKFLSIFWSIQKSTEIKVAPQGAIFLSARILARVFRASPGRAVRAAHRADCVVSPFRLSSLMPPRQGCCALRLPMQARCVVDWLAGSRHPCTPFSRSRPACALHAGVLLAVFEPLTAALRRAGPGQFRPSNRR